MYSAFFLANSASWWPWLVVAYFGAILGSFINVVALRYDPDQPLFSIKSIGGRSRCPACHRPLRWFELVPVVSFFLLRARCARCRAPISWQYVIVEIANGLLLASITAAVATPFAPAWTVVASFFCWAVIFELLFIMALIDRRLRLIPDEVSVGIIVCGLLLAVLQLFFSAHGGSYLGPYAGIFGLQQSFILNKIIAIALSLLLFGGIYASTRGRGMGLGDVKLAAALAVAFGWPDIALVFACSFVVGALVGLFKIAREGATMKTTLAFGPFLGIGALIIFFFGQDLLRGYFSLFGIFP